MKNLLIYVANKINFKIFVTIAIDNKLYIDEEGYELKELYQLALKRSWNRQKNNVIALAYDGNEVIGVVFVFDWLISFYVKPKYRRLGVATKLYGELKREYPFVIEKLADTIDKGSIEFFKTLDIDLFQEVADAVITVDDRKLLENG